MSQNDTLLVTQMESKPQSHLETTNNISIISPRNVSMFKVSVNSSKRKLKNFLKSNFDMHIKSLLKPIHLIKSTKPPIVINTPPTSPKLLVNIYKKNNSISCHNLQEIWDNRLNLRTCMENKIIQGKLAEYDSIHRQRLFVI